MTVSTSRKAYKDCYDLFDRALAAPLGIRNRCTDPGQANHLRVRLHQARILLRRESLSIYAEEDPNHGASPYDSLIVRIKDVDGHWWVYLEPRMMNGVVEELTEDTPTPPASPMPEYEIKRGKVEVFKKRKITV